jgi:hypothetical protein
MIIAMIDNCNDCSFAIKIANEAAAEKTKEYMQEGLSAWYCAAHTPIDYEGEYFSKEEVESFYDAGYAEPTEELLTKNGIEFELVDIEYDEDGNVTNADEIITY